MDGDNSSLMETGLDLNLDPMIQPLNSVSDSVERVNHRSPNDLESENNMPIEHRIRCIQHLSTQMSTCPNWGRGGPSGTAVTNGDNAPTDVGSLEAFYENGRCYNRNSADLVAKALEKEMLDLKKEVKKQEKKVGSYYDCNICFELAKEPVLTCCGHLFCWNCFYNIPYIDSCTKECPVCDGEVSDSTIIPIYGNGGGKNDCNEVHISKIPPRPKARRVESVRPLVPVYLSHVPVVDALRRIRISFGNLPDPSNQRTAQNGVLNADMDSRLIQNANRVRTRRMRTRQVTRLLSENAASNTNPASPVGNPDELGSATSGLVQNNVNVLPLDMLESNNVLRGSTAAVGVIALPVNTSSLRSADVSGYVPNGTSPIVVPSYPYNLRSRSRRSTNGSSASDVGNRDSNVSRRRRLN